MQNFKIVAYLLLGSTDSRGYVRFTPKYSIVGGEGGVSDYLEAHAIRVRKINTKNSGLPRLLCWSHALHSDQNTITLM